MSAQVQRYLTPAEYLAIERQAPYKSECYAGEMFAMAGASERHGLIVGNVTATLNLQFEGRECRVYASDMRLKVSATGLYTYPDVVAVCGAPQLEDEHFDTLLNPTVIVEVLSKSTEAYDRGWKFQPYCEIESLREYVLISQDGPYVEQFVRQPGNTWVLSQYKGQQDVVRLPSIQCELRLAKVYDKLDVQQPTHPSLERGTPT